MIVPVCSHCWTEDAGSFFKLTGTSAHYRCAICQQVSRLELELDLVDALRVKPKVQKPQKLQTKIIHSDDIHDPWAAVWRNPQTTLTTVLPVRTRKEAEQALRDHPNGPPRALWLPTNVD